MISDPFSSSGGNLTGLCVDFFPITPSDSADLLASGRSCFVSCKGAAGNITVVTASGESRTYPIAVDEIVPVGIARVLSTGTTATTLWAFVP